MVLIIITINSCYRFMIFIYCSNGCEVACELIKEILTWGASRPCILISHLIRSLLTWPAIFNQLDMAPIICMFWKYHPIVDFQVFLFPLLAFLKLKILSQTDNFVFRSTKTRCEYDSSYVSLWNIYVCVNIIKFDPILWILSIVSCVSVICSRNYLGSSFHLELSLPLLLLIL